MKKYILYIFIITLVTFVSCQKDLDVSPYKSTLQTLIVSLPADCYTTRVSFTDGENDIVLNWEESDKFAIYTMDGDYITDFQYSADADGKSIFTAISSATSLSDNTDYIAIYPAIDSPSTLNAHHAELANRLAEQIQSGNNNCNHLNDALRMEAQFTYYTTESTLVTFTHNMASASIEFAYDGFIPSKVVFVDGDYASYTLYFNDVTETTTYISYFVIEPNLEGVSRELTFDIYKEGCDYPSRKFSASSSAIYSSGVQYRLTLALEDVVTCIYTKEDLIEFRDLVNKGSSGINAILMDNIDMEGESWTPIGADLDYYYAGTFDGGGYTISNLTIDSSEGDYQGLFGCVKGGSISNLTLKDSQVEVGIYVGALCGYIISETTISECGVERGAVSISSTSVVYVGGVVGFSYSSYITSCYNTGEVTGSSSSSSAYVGGVTGYSGSVVTSCYNTGTITGYSSSFNYGCFVGGVAGCTFDANVSSCYNIGEVVGNPSSSSSYTGGVVGYVLDSKINVCYNKGEVTVNSGYTTSFQFIYVGGVAGHLINSNVTSCYNTGALTGKSNNYSSYSTISVGGVVGYVRAYYDSNFTSYSSTFTSCYNIGSIIGSSSYIAYIGGVAGYTFSSDPGYVTITSCYYNPSSTSYTNTYGTYSSSLLTTMTGTAIISTLNTAAGDTYYEQDTNNYNNGYPILVNIDYQ